LSKALFSAHLFKAPVTRDQAWSQIRWQIATETGWLLEYIDDLTYHAIWEWLSIRHAEGKIAQSKPKKGKGLFGKGKKRR
jgi:hypothetical protein